MKRLLRIKLAMVTMLLAITYLCNSCVKRTFDERDPEFPVDISFGWSSSTPPSTMELYFYNSDGTVKLFTKTCSGRGFSGNLPEGIYKVLAYNSDAIGIKVGEDATYDKAQIIATDGPTKAVSISQPSNVYGVGVNQLVVSNSGSDIKKITPNALVRQVTLDINVTGEKSSVKSCNTTLSGIARAVNISTGALVPDEGIISFTPLSTSSGFQASVSFFGRIPVSTNNLTSVIQFVGGGDSQVITGDITDKLTTALGTGGVVAPVEIKLNVEVTGTEKAGFKATLKSWNVIKRNLQVEY